MMLHKSTILNGFRRLYSTRKDNTYSLFFHKESERELVKRFWILTLTTVMCSSTFVYLRSLDIQRKRRNQFAPSPFLHAYENGIYMTTFFDSESVLFDSEESNKM